VRTLLNWRQAAGRPIKRQGRPPATYAERREVQAAVRWVIKRQGWNIGWRIMVLSLSGARVSVIKWALADLKAARGRKIRKLRAELRVHYHYTHKEVVLAQDSAHVGQSAEGNVWIEALKDPATSFGEVIGDGAPVTTVIVLQHFELLKEEDRLPLVWQTDNCSAYCSTEVARWLKEHQVIHLRSRVATPQDNGSMEKFNGEIKTSFYPLTPTTYHSTKLEGPSMGSEISDRLNAERPRQSKGGKTAYQLTLEVPRWNIKVDREVFYKAACDAIQVATQGLKGREARTAEREAIFQTLERFGLLIRTRGDGSVS
jgi:hypothetical protein